VVDLLSIAEASPRRAVDRGEVLLTDGEPVRALLVLQEGALRIEKAGVPIAVVTDPGACVGEMSLLLGVPATADVIAIEPSTVAVIEDAATMLEGETGLALVLAQLLARRLQVMTTYLADIKRQYADHEGGLGMIDTVLTSLMRGSGQPSEFGSDRDPDPEF
jgi:CRP-like cAMP-binding protein